ncbi:transmembrane protein 208 [Folsomia candida]|uniref:Transmembrane protein 208 n=1 Tax=Folsomia candida TaxID=158441 RepID=A0A226F374_FOLCA|nr:transmembrane protein 208 [Folsomia candida]OXA63874.1 hypothetical protein Fcan01_03503 [Folsomia candida]
MVVITQKKGKEGTKGAKQIVEENKSTLSFYRNMFLGGLFAQLFGTFAFFGGASGWDYFFVVFGIIINTACYQFMVFMSKPTLSESGAVVDSGVDLNMPAGVAEHVKDVLILTCGCQVLSLLSRYCWFLWLLVPLRGFYYVWSKLIAPWIFAPAPETNTAGDEKKQRKMDRRMRR